ncbi:MAG: single-stranded-DNA-specific exonuclease RecJ [Lachnospiraceae bacterium]|nr:single-stranded-DNA-specific exonuclease RecJ [Lachnospiraceae bacterium]
MKTNWSYKAQTSLTEDEIGQLASDCEISQAFAKILANRGYDTKEAVDKYLFRDKTFVGYDGNLMLDMANACEIMCNAIKDGKRIRIVADYDVDGVTSSYIFLKGFERVKEAYKSTAIVDYYLPHRIHDGYGINENIVKTAYNDGVELIITCDNGIAAMEAAELAKNLNIAYVITDHHEPKDELPEALAVVDPHRESDPYPFKDICGAVVAYKLVEQMYKKAGVDRNRLPELFAYAALGTVCDVMPLVDENRYIVKRGLVFLRNQLKKGEADIGMTSLVNALELTADDVDCLAFGFRIGPSINAAGRLSNAKWALKLLLENDKTMADKRAISITKLNEIRKKITASAVNSAMEMVAEHPDDKVLVIYVDKCHESVAGIVAGRIREAVNKPTLILTKSKTKGVLKGSARSIEKYNMFESLKEFEHLFIKFGGHKMAAGFSILEENLDALRDGLNEKADLSYEDFELKLDIDMLMELDDISVDFANEIELMEPCGTANERPIFATNNVLLKDGKILGKNHNFIKMNLLTSNSDLIEGVKFMEPPEEFFEELNEACDEDVFSRFDRGDELKLLVDIVYKPKVNEFRGTIKAQADLLAIRPSNI